MLLNRLLFRKRRPHLRSYLLGLVAVALIPAFGVGAGTAYVMHRNLRQSFETRLAETADAIAVAVDRHIETRRAVVDAFTGAVALDALVEDGPRDPDWVRQRLMAVYEVARRVAGKLGSPIALFRPDGSMLFRTSVPFREKAAPLLAIEEFRRVVATKAPVIGNLYREPRMLVPVLVPVIRNGEVIAVLAAGISVNYLARVLGEMQPASAEFVSIADGNGRIVAAVPSSSSAAVGQQVCDWQRQAIRDNPSGGLAQGTSVLGVPVVAALHPIPTTPGWVVTVAAPMNAYGLIQSQPLFWMLLGSITVFLLSLAAALYLAQRLVRPVVALTQQAEEQITMARPRPRITAETAASPVAEIEMLQQAIARASEVQTLLNREVDHRAKNLLAVVQSVIRMSRAETTVQFVAAVTERINALARVHSLLAQEGWEGASLLALAEREFAAYADRVMLHGPPVSLVSTAVQPVSMLLHELATNAVKYGALLAPEGRVEVTWLLETTGNALHLCWREKGGPPIEQAPTHRGFGSRVIDATAAQLGGTVQRHWHPSGLLCEVRLPLQRVLRSGEPKQSAEVERTVGSKKGRRAWLIRSNGRRPTCSF